LTNVTQAAMPTCFIRPQLAYLAYRPRPYRWAQLIELLLLDNDCNMTSLIDLASELKQQDFDGLPIMSVSVKERSGRFAELQRPDTCYVLR